jgi:predicted permease
MEFTVLLRRLRHLLHRGRFDRELDEEMRLHRDLEIEARVAEGMDPTQARHAVSRRFGNPVRLVEASRDAWGLRWLEELASDLRYGLRALARNPGFAATAILSLALGIGATSAVFSVMNAVLLRPLPVEAPEQLVVLKASYRGQRRGISYPVYRDLSARQRLLIGIAATSGQGRKRMSLAETGADLDQVRTSRVSTNYFRVLGVEPQLGRVFTAEDEAGAPVAVISHGFWLRQLGGDPSALGRGLRMEIGNAPNIRRLLFTVIGVTPASFFGETPGTAPDVWLPLAHGVMPDLLTARDGFFLDFIGRLAPGVTRAQAQAELAPLYRRLLDEEVAAGGRSGVRAGQSPSEYVLELQGGARGLDELGRRFSKTLTLLLAAVATVLLAACANLSTLLLARGAARRREIGMRVALGAGRLRLVRQLLTESLLLAAIGGALGLAFAVYGGPALVALISDGGGIVLDVAPDRRVLGFTLLASAATGMLIGLVPVFGSTRLDVAAALRADSEASAGSRPGRRFTRVLVALQVALAVGLLGPAALLAGSLRKLYDLDAGFDRRNVVLVGVEIHSVPKPQRTTLAAELDGRLNALPGVRSASLSMAGMFSGGSLRSAISVEGESVDPGALIRANAVTPGFFTTLGIGLTAGRDFTAQDTAASPRVVIIDQALARARFGASSPLGRRISRGERFDPTTALEIVGVAHNSKYNDLRGADEGIVYLPIAQAGWDFNSVEVKAAGEPLALAAELRRTLREAEPSIEIQDIRTLETQVGRTLVAERLLAALSGAFGLVTLGVAAIGLFGVVSYSVTRRRREFGIRLALGARPPALVRFAAREVVALAAAGLALGLGLAVGAGRALESYLFGLKPWDPSVLGVVAAAVVAVALGAGYVPARRVTQIDPIAALRRE